MRGLAGRFVRRHTGEASAGVAEGAFIDEPAQDRVECTGGFRRGGKRPFPTHVCLLGITAKSAGETANRRVVRESQELPRAVTAKVELLGEQRLGEGGVGLLDGVVERAFVERLLGFCVALEAQAAGECRPPDHLGNLRAHGRPEVKGAVAGFQQH